MNKLKVRYIGLSKRGGGLKNIHKYKQDNDSDDGDDEESDEESEEEPEENVAHRQIEARNWLSEGRKEYNWYLSILTDKHESIVRANEQPNDIMNLIKSFIK